MKLKHRDIGKDGKGYVVLLPEEPEDMWHAYNLIQKHDKVRSTTVRRVQSESSTGSTASERIRLTITIEVQGLYFDSQSGVLQVTGPNETESKHIKLGAFHTLDLELNREFSVYKDEWDTIALEIVQNATDPTKFADVAAIVMQEGLAHVCLITSTMTIVRARIEVPIPRKRRGAAEGHEKGLNKFFDTIKQAIQTHINFGVVKCILVGSPGFLKDQFFEYLFLEATRHDIKPILENKSKFVLVHSSSGHKHALKELLSDPAIVSRLADTKASGEVRALNEFYDMLKNEPDRAFYGYKHVQLAADRAAIQTLMVTDELFRSSDITTRKKYVRLVESVKESGGEVRIFSSMHVSGEQLAQLSGIAAILRFPLPEIEDVAEDEENADDTNNNNNN